MEEIGAEALVSISDQVRKERYKKGYRIRQLDEKLRKFRTKRECKVLENLEELDFPSPRVIKKDKYDIMMTRIRGKKVRDVLEETDHEKICKEIGFLLATLHNNNIIHGDLTTSNMILDDKVYFIDFGLSKFSEKIEDKAVDIHLLRKALESKHEKIYKQAFRIALDEYYKNVKNKDEIKNRLEQIELRGRYKKK